MISTASLFTAWISNLSYVQVTGCNVIGTSLGRSMKNLLLVGAHYDSSGVKTDNAPLRDNGVGTAVMLEVASALEGSIRWKGFARNFTTIFVAFDLNTEEQVCSDTYYYYHSTLLVTYLFETGETHNEE